MCSVAGIEGTASRVSGVRLGDGERRRRRRGGRRDRRRAGDRVARGQRLEAARRHRLRPDAACRRRVIYAAGDCARWVERDVRCDGEEMRVEHWTNAAEQGAAAARNLLAELAGEPADPVRSRCRSSGATSSTAASSSSAGPTATTRCSVFAGDPDGSFVALYGHGGRLRGVLGVSMPRMVMPFRKLLADGATWDEALDHADGTQES